MAVWRNYLIRIFILALSFLAFGIYAGYDSFNANIGSQNYFDVAASFQWKKVEFRGGINNITDKIPPFLGSEIVSGGAANTYGQYDMFGRQLFFGVNFKL